MIDLHAMLEKLMEFAVAGAVESLRELMEEVDSLPSQPGFWTTPLGHATFAPWPPRPPLQGTWPW
jgi:hypothetical protein